MSAPEIASGSPWDPLDLAVARSVIRWGGDYTEVPAAAVEALQLGADGEQLIVLAGMEGAGWSEVDVQVDRVYPAERGAPKPSGRPAVELVAGAFVRRAADEDINGLRAMVLAEDLWIRLGCPDGDLGKLGTFNESLSLIRAGLIESTPASIVTKFVEACEQIVAAGGPVIGDDIDLSPPGR